MRSKGLSFMARWGKTFFGLHSILFLERTDQIAKDDAEVGRESVKNKIHL